MPVKTGIFSMRRMSLKPGYLLALSLAIPLGLCVVFFWPYLQARLRPLEPLSTPGAEGVQPERLAANLLIIPSLGVEAPIIYMIAKTEAAYQEALRFGVGHYPDTVQPGELGNVYIFGHSSDYIWTAGEYKTVFARLPDIALGAEIVATNGIGEVFRYAVIETRVVGPRDLSVLDQQNYARRLLTLQTSYPLGTALQRYIVLAEIQPQD